MCGDPVFDSVTDLPGWRRFDWRDGPFDPIDADRRRVRFPIAAMNHV
jgi:hypothetical protein